MEKQLIIFLLVMGVAVGGMVYYHLNTENPFDGEAFFGPKDSPAEPSSQPQNSRP